MMQVTSERQFSEGNVFDFFSPYTLVGGVTPSKNSLKNFAHRQVSSNLNWSAVSRIGASITTRTNLNARIMTSVLTLPVPRWNQQRSHIMFHLAYTQHRLEEEWENHLCCIISTLLNWSEPQLSMTQWKSSIACSRRSWIWRYPDKVHHHPTLQHWVGKKKNILLIIPALLRHLYSSKFGTSVYVQPIHNEDITTLSDKCCAEPRWSNRKNFLGVLCTS